MDTLGTHLECADLREVLIVGVGVYIVTRGSLDLVFALMITIIIHASITHNQDNGFALVLAHSYNINLSYHRGK